MQGRGYVVQLPQSRMLDLGVWVLEGPARCSVGQLSQLGFKMEVENRVGGMMAPLHPRRARKKEKKDKTGGRARNSYHQAVMNGWPDA